MKTLATLAIALALSVAGAAQGAAQKRVALVIGNSEYENTVYLPNPRNDAVSLSEVLRRLGFEVLERTDLRHTDMQATLLEYSERLRGADVGLFFYSGHGLQVDDRNYLVPVDAELRSEVDLAFETTELDVVMRILQRQTRTGLVFLDACRNNPLASNLTRSMGATRSAAVGNGLARVDTGVGMLITFATQPGNVALDGTGNHSPFTEALLEFIETPGIDVAQMLRRVRDKVINMTNGKQVPWNNSSLTEDFYFRPEVKEEPQVAALPPAPEPAPAATAESSAVRAPGNQGNVAIELAFWQSIVNSDDPAVFEAYLEQFPDGSFSSLARLRLKTLQGQAAAPQAAPSQPAVTQQTVTAAPAPAVEAPKVAEPPKPVEAVAAVPPQPVLQTKPEPKPEQAESPQLAALPPAEPKEPDYRVRPLDEIQFALKVSNVRAGPGTSYAPIGRLGIGEEVNVVGKVEGQNWYQIALSAGRQGFVFGSLLSPDSPSAKVASPAPAPKKVEVPQPESAAKPVEKKSGPTAEQLALREEQNYWDGLRNSRNPLDYDRYLIRYGENGLFSEEARRRSASLRAKQAAAQTATASKAAGGGQGAQQTTATSRDTSQGTGAAPSAAPSTATEAIGTAAPEQTAELTPPTETLPSAKYDGTWEGKAVTRFGTLCKSSYAMEAKIANKTLSGTMKRSSQNFVLSAKVDSLGTIQGFEGIDRVRVIFKVSSATDSEIQGFWDMGQIQHGATPCRGIFTLTRAGS